MKEEGWENVTHYIKYVLFGSNREKKVDKLIESKDPETIGILLRQEVMQLANCYVYYRYRYDKDMRQLYQEEGVELKDWTAATNKWHIALLKKLEDTFTIIRKIAVKLGLEDFFLADSDNVEIDLETASKEELDALAAQIMKENIAMGNPNTFE